MAVRCSCCRQEVPDFRLSTRTFHIVDPASSLLSPISLPKRLVQFWYWHMNFHIEHHMYAAVVRNIQTAYCRFRWTVATTSGGCSLPVCARGGGGCSRVIVCQPYTRRLSMIYPRPPTASSRCGRSSWIFSGSNAGEFGRGGSVVRIGAGALVACLLACSVCSVALTGVSMRCLGLSVCCAGVPALPYLQRPFLLHAGAAAPRQGPCAQQAAHP
jgi:hypothetical protein